MIRLAVRVRREDAELALAELLALAPGGGVEEVDLGDRVEYAIYGAEGEVPSLPAVQAAAGDALVEVSTTTVADDWDERWKDFHQPVHAGGFLVRAPWHAPAPTGSDEVVIDPAQAFGTGAHDTTRLCLELLADVEPRGALVDLGCGSGVLAIAAARRGFAPVTGLDFDPLAVEATAENARRNGVEVHAARHDLLEGGRPAPRAPTVVANILRPVLLAVAAAGWDGPPPRTLVLSGLLRHETDEVAAAFAGLREDARAESGDWAAVRLVS